MTATSHRVIALMDAQNYIAATALARQFASEYPSLAEAHFLLARSLTESGDMQQGLEAAERACQLAPGNFEYLHYCGLVYFRFGLFEYALPYLKKSVAIQPNAPNSLLTLAECYLSIGNGGRATEHFRNALRMNQDESVKDEIRFKLATCLTASRKNDEAKLLLNRLAKSRGPFQFDAVCELANTSRDGPDSKTGLQLKGFINQGSLERLQSVNAYLALGKLHANAKDFDAAFEAWALSRAQAKAEDWRLRNADEDYAALTTFYSRELFNLCRPFGHDSRAPVFVVGMPRSGTTLTEQIIAAHPEATGVGELARWSKLDDALRDDYKAENHEMLMASNAEKGELKNRAQEALDFFSTIVGSIPARIVEKTPHNFVQTGYLALCFPHAKFIHIHRHPADTFISSYQNNLNPTHGYAYDQVEYAKEYVFHDKIMAYWKTQFPDNILTVQYEKLTADPEQEARKIMAFLELPWDDACLRFFERQTTVRTFSTHQVRNPVYQSSVERWRVYEKHLQPLLTALADMHFTYPPQ